MRRLLLLLAVTLGIGCDNPALLANIDTYTCAYLPGAIDCTTQEVHDKAVGLLEHGVVASQVDCECDVSRIASPPATISGSQAHYRAQRLIDGSCFVSSWFSNLAFYSRTDPQAASCRTQSGGASMELEDGILTFHNGPSDVFEGVADQTCCTGFGFEAFGVE